MNGGWFEIFPISAVEPFACGLPAWRWMAIVQIRVPGREFPVCRCFRTMCPLRLARWVYLVGLRVWRQHNAGGRLPSVAEVIGRAIMAAHNETRAGYKKVDFSDGPQCVVTPPDDFREIDL